VLRAVGRHAIELPLASTATARWALADAGVELPDGPLELAVEGDRVRIADTWLEAGRAVELRLALAEAAESAGLLETVQRLTVEHVRTREQFGVPIARFPVVRDRLALLAEHVAAARAVVDVARAALAARDAEFAVAAAKVCTAEAATEATRIAHQLHGAIGVTTEHVLQRYTRRLWALRGDEVAWARRLGAALAGDGVWERLVAEAS
jgi:acyl-CoA dehydrogenase